MAISDKRDRSYRIGIMHVDIDPQDPAAFKRTAERGTELFQNQLREETQLSVEAFPFSGPHITADAGTYSPLDFIQLGIAERAERNFSFLLIITNVDLSSSRMTYTLALPSQITNVAIISTRRLDPSYWGLEKDPTLTAQRLGTLMMHSFGRLLNLPHSDDPKNLMSKIGGVESLDSKIDFTPAQVAHMREQLPKESLDAVTGSQKGAFALKTLTRRMPTILRAVAAAHPVKLVSKLPTMIATALSVIVVLVFGAETWDYAGEVSPLKITIFSLFAFSLSVYVLYRSFAFDAILSRDGKLMESTVVTAAATALSLLAAVTLLYIFLGGLMWAVAETAFPEKLKETWSTVDPVTSLGDQAKLAAFLASIGILSGSLGGAADSRNVIRNVLFTKDET